MTDMSVVVPAATANEQVDPDLHIVLREELEARGWGVGKLADEVGVRFGVARRWLQPDDEQRVVPLPAMCIRIARALEWDVLDVFRHAGYLPMPTGEVPRDPHEGEIRIFKRRLERMLQHTPERQWPFTMACVQVMLDQLQALLSRGPDLLD